MATTILPYLKSALDLVYPRNCRVCEAPLRADEPGVLCAQCLTGVKWIEEPFCRRCARPFRGAVPAQIECGYCHQLEFHFSRAVAACRAEGIVRDCIHHFKYHRELYYLPHLSDWLTTAARRWLDWSEVDAIVPVPLHPVKERHREFNQAALLARDLGRTFGKPVFARCVRRIKVTATQTRLDAAARRANLRGAFAIRPPACVAGQRLALVDDVFTTGATLDACASVLVQAGARDVLALTVARGV
jgi:ComF family protein